MDNEKLVGGKLEAERVFDVDDEFDGVVQEQKRNTVGKISELADRSEKKTIIAVLPPNRETENETKKVAIVDDDNDFDKNSSVDDIIKQAKAMTIKNASDPAKLNDDIQKMSEAIIALEDNK